MLPTMVDEELEELKEWRFVRYANHYNTCSLRLQMVETKTFKVYWKYKGIMCAPFPVT